MTQPMRPTRSRILGRLTGSLPVVMP
jgi:hypothetical protein